MDLIDERLETEIENDVVIPALQWETGSAMEGIGRIVDEMYSRIPGDKRTSYGIVHVIDTLSDHLYSCLKGEPSLLEISSSLFQGSEGHRVKGVVLGIIANLGIEDIHGVIPHFESAAASDDWNMRELAQFFFRRVIKGHPEDARKHLSSWSRSPDPMLRRFVAETLRPVKENKWFYKEPEYPLSVLRGLFREHNSYPRTSIGNNLSDLSKKLPEIVLKIVEELAATGNRDSYWIAYRACRNMVKERPEKVMRLLGVNEYKYKKRRYVLK
ncbi:MAG: hypothetical protein JW825_03850 [Candidatus Methanofastidiosa archaeon]|nr:hypothetical protein [Candidatus Methanofastidiosa archaeon]